MTKTIGALFLGILLGSAMSGKPQVARIWHGRVQRARGDEYQKYLYESGVKKLRQIPKNEGVLMLRSDSPGDSEFIVISLWPDRDAIHAYAGSDIEKVHSLPRDPEFLLEVEPKVKHFDVIADEK
jgi:heme-degrading monooxygenase HmoA